MAPVIDFYRYDGLIFDLDGTLIDSMPFHVRAWQQVCQEHGNFPLDPQFIYDRGGCSSQNIVSDLGEHGCAVGSIPDFVKRKVELYRAHLNEVPLFPEVFAILKKAKERGALITIGTGTQRQNVIDILQIHNCSHLVDFIVSSDDVTKHKPDPETYNRSLELMQLKPEQCIVVEDGLPGIQAAAAAFIDSVTVANDKIISFNPAPRA